MRAWIDCSPGFIAESDLPRWLPRGWKVVGSLDAPHGTIRLVIEDDDAGTHGPFVEATLEIAETEMSRSVTMRFKE